MVDAIQKRILDKFFDPVINADDIEGLRAWLMEQSTEEIEIFHRLFNFENFPDRETIIEQELTRRYRDPAQQAVQEKDMPKKDEPDPRKVFVVHGRNADARGSMFDFLRSVGLNPIEWSQAIALTGKPSPYVGEILDAAFAEAQAVVVLLTGDDVAKLRAEFLIESDPETDKHLTPQARPNVLFEAGMAFGTHQDRTVLVEMGDLRPFSDIAGRHVVRIDNSTEKRQDLLDRLKIAGCPVDLSGRDWHTKGDFEITKYLEEEEQAQIHLSLSEEILSTGMNFGILHVRDGKDEVEDKGPLLNIETKFQEIDRRGTLQASIKYRKSLGFQFKCFANYRGIKFDEAKEILDRHGYMEVTKGEGKQSRAWFILSDYSTCITVDGIKNNFFYPA